MTDPMDICDDSNRVTGREAGARMDICRACPQFDAEATVCREDGAALNTKSWLKAAACPLAKWGQLLDQPDQPTDAKEQP